MYRNINITPCIQSPAPYSFLGLLLPYGLQSLSVLNLIALEYLRSVGIIKIMKINLKEKTSVT